MENNFDKLQAKMGLTAKNLSQMSHISEKGISSRLDKTLTAESNHKLEVRISNLKKLHAFLVSQQNKLSAMMAVSATKQMVIATTVLRSVESVRDKPNLPQGSSGILRKVVNEIISIREGVLASVPNEELVSRQFPRAISEVRSLIETAEARFALAKNLESSDSFAEETYKRVQNIIEQNKGEAKKLDSIQNKPFTVVRVPIVPIAEPAINPLKLNQQGVKAEDMAGYPIVHSQLVIGLNKEILEKRGRKTQTPLEAAQEILQTLSKQTNKKLVLVDEVPHRAKGALWYWVAEQNFVNKLMKAANGRLNIKRWGFGMDA